MVRAGYVVDPLFNKANDAVIDHVNAAITAGEEWIHIYQRSVFKKDQADQYRRLF